MFIDEALDFAEADFCKYGGDVHGLGKHWET